LVPDIPFPPNTPIQRVDAYLYAHTSFAKRLSIETISGGFSHSFDLTGFTMDTKEVQKVVCLKCRWVLEVNTVRTFPDLPAFVKINAEVVIKSGITSRNSSSGLHLAKKMRSERILSASCLSRKLRPRTESLETS
jgi:hypothetical protein